MRAFTPKTPELLPGFLLAYIEAKQKDLLFLVKWSTTVQSINREELESFPIPLPPVEIQQNIISKVDKFQNAIEECKKERLLLVKSTQKKIENLILGTLSVEDL